MKTQRQKATREDRILTKVFETDDGKTALKYLEAIFYNNSTFDPNSVNMVMYKVGQQDVIGFIKETMEIVNQPTIVSVGKGVDSA